MMRIYKMLFLKISKMKIIENNILPVKGFSAIMLFGVIFVRPGVKLSDRTIRHEEIHRRQMFEMLIIFFYLWYCTEFLLRCVSWSPKEAYRRISFEREAYANEGYNPYNRKPYAWLKYL